MLWAMYDAFYHHLERLRLNELLVTTADAAEILDRSPTRVKTMAQQPNYAPWFVPALEIELGRRRLRMYWRHKIEELARLLKEHPHTGGPLPWQPPIDTQRSR